MLRAAPEIPPNLRITGLRGVGKSVLLKELATIAKAEGWVAIRHQLEPRHNTEADLTNLLVSSIERAKERMSRTRRVRAALGDAVSAGRQLLSVTVEDITFSLGGEAQVEADLATSLFEVVEAALDTGHNGFAILLDEAQILRDDTDRNGDHPVSMLVAAVNVLQENGLPIALIMCGLPSLRANLQRARTYSERMFRGQTIGELQGNPGPARDAFEKPLADTGVTATDGLIGRVLQEVEGYPFFIQLWGAELWDAAQDAGIDILDEALLDTIEGDIYRRLDDEFYAGRVETLTPSEQDLLMDTASCPYPPLMTADIRARSNKSSGNVNVLMGRLTDQGIVYRIQKGQYAYTAPKFHEYLIRRARTM